MEPNRCEKCLINIEHCFCENINSVQISGRVDIIMHKSELRFTNNTAILSKNSIDQCHIHIKGLENKPLNYEFIDEDNFTPVYLYPSDQAHELSKEYIDSFDKPIQLIVPDGTWTQTKRFFKKEVKLLNIPRVKISPNNKSIYSLREQVDDLGLCTHEAIAYALEIIEGARIKEQLLENLKAMNEAHKLARVNPDYKMRYYYESIPD